MGPFDQALQAHRNGQFAEAETLYKKIVSTNPKNFDALHLLGVVCSETGNYEDAEKSFRAALSIDPKFPPCYHNFGLYFVKRKQYQAAIEQFDKALALFPEFAPVYSDRGSALVDVGRLDEALASLNRAVGLAPNMAVVWFNRANIFFKKHDYDLALNDYDQAIKINANYASAWIGRGNVFMELKRYDEAVVAYEKAIALNPDVRNDVVVAGIQLHAKMHLCDWRNFDTESQSLMLFVKNGAAAVPPFVLLSIPSSSSDHLQCAKRWIADKHPPQKALWLSERYKRGRHIRIAYVSSDFRHHPMSYLIAGLIEGHSRDSFDVIGISLLPEDRSEIGQRMKRAFVKFIDVSGLTDEKIAELIHQLEIDIAIDLNGFTQNSRTNIFARRAAPVQVSYMGFPGTMGAEYIDYIIADQVIIPPADVSNYSEKIVWLPDTYWVADRKLAIAPKNPSRTEAGLPESAFVFCCFNQTYKILPEAFDCWMRILTRVNEAFFGYWKQIQQLQAI
jgi:protein O-GlcNAc transferase